jgi:D-alanine-D-alanine ligase
MTRPDRVRLVVLFGGRSAEHEVSCTTAAHVLAAADPDRYEVVPVGITREGAWVQAGEAQATLLEGARGLPENVAPLTATGAAVEPLPSVTPAAGGLPVVVLPLLHGPQGEDGTVQGMLELADVPYVGSGVLASALCMDKVKAKEVLAAAGLGQVPYLALRDTELDRAHEAVAAEGLAYPLFVKPANMGSSVGVSKARTAEEFEACCRLAFRFDRKILIERCVAPVREIECSVLEDANGNIRASQLGEIVPADKHGFYSYDAKYLDDDGAALQVPADVPPSVADRIREFAIKTFRVLGCEGMARVDFFLNGEQVFVNEANTLPGFTNISMYPRLWEASGLSQSDLMDVLIGHALERHKVSRNLAFQRE